MLDHLAETSEDGSENSRSESDDEWSCRPKKQNLETKDGEVLEHGGDGKLVGHDWDIAPNKDLLGKLQEKDAKLLQRALALQAAVGTDQIDVSIAKV